MTIQKINPVFVTLIPEKLESGNIYVSMEYKTALHKCACGCGEEVVTPISPQGWTITYNGDLFSLSPSIGNWSYKCRSHYWVTQNKIVWAENWTEEEVENVRKKESTSKKLWNSLKNLFKQHS